MRVGSKWNAVALCAASMVTVLCSGCLLFNPNRAEIMPGLADVRVLGPNGQKCYDHCAVLHSNCQHMCPRTKVHEKYDCADDCVTDSKFCLNDCPELEKPVIQPH